MWSFQVWHTAQKNLALLPECIYNSHNTVMGCRQCLPLSVVQLKGKHCRKPHCRNGVVDTFGQKPPKLTDSKIKLDWLTPQASRPLVSIIQIELADTNYSSRAPMLKKNDQCFILQSVNPFSLPRFTQRKNFSFQGIAGFQKLFLFRVPMNPQQRWKANLKRAYSFRVQSDEITVCVLKSVHDKTVFQCFA